MRKNGKFCSYIENRKYGVGCTGSTVVVFNKSGCELAKFKDLTYVYEAVLSPLDDGFVVKSVDGRLAVYSLDTLSLVKKLRFSSVKYAQDDGFCFSEDGKYFINIERQGDDLHNVISVYTTADFSKISETALGDRFAVSEVECDGCECFVTGFARGTDGVAASFFVAQYRDNAVCDPVEITAQEYEFYNEQIAARRRGENAGERGQIARIWRCGKGTYRRKDTI